MPVLTLHLAFRRVCQLRDTSSLIPSQLACPWTP